MDDLELPLAAVEVLLRYDEDPPVSMMWILANKGDELPDVSNGLRRLAYAIDRAHAARQ